MNCTTLFVSTKLMVFGGRRLVLPCTRGERPLLVKLALRFLNLLAEIVCKKRKVFLHTFCPLCQKMVYVCWRSSDGRRTVCSLVNVNALSCPSSAMSSSALVNSLHWPLNSRYWSRLNWPLHCLPLCSTQPQPLDTNAWTDCVSSTSRHSGSGRTKAESAMLLISGAVVSA